MGLPCREAGRSCGSKSRPPGWEACIWAAQEPHLAAKFPIAIALPCPAGRGRGGQGRLRKPRSEKGGAALPPPPPQRQPRVSPTSRRFSQGDFAERGLALSPPSSNCTVTGTTTLRLTGGGNLAPPLPWKPPQSPQGTTKPILTCCIFRRKQSIKSRGQLGSRLAWWALAISFTRARSFSKLANIWLCGPGR